MADQAPRTRAALAAYRARLAINDPYPTFEGKSLVEAMQEEAVLDRLDRLEAERAAADALAGAAEEALPYVDSYNAAEELKAALDAYERVKAT